MFEQELTVTLDAILVTPTSGTVYPSRFDVRLRRVLMPKTKNHVYFAVENDEVVVLSVWGAPRGQGPKL